MITYWATNTSNGKFYIGSTTNFEKRKQAHHYSKEKYPFQNALRNNPELFEWEFVEDNCDEPVLEQALLDMWFGTEMCYNLNPLASKPPSQRGVPKTQEHKEKIRKATLGQKRSPETCQKIGASKKGNQYQLGRKRSQETKNLLSKLKEGYNPPTNSQTWESTVDGYISTAAGVAAHNRHRGWDPNARRRVQSD